MAVQTYLWQTDTMLFRIDQTLIANLTLNDPIFRHFPLKPTQNHQVSWEQRDNYLGLQKIRGWDGDPQSVPRIGSTRYIKTPSVFGEFSPVSEFELASRAAPGTFDMPIDISDLVGERTEQLRTRQVNRMAWMLWTLVVTGTYTIFDSASGALVDQDAYLPLTYAAGVTWATHATATPLADFRAVQVKHRGQSVTFGSGATAYMNQTTFNDLIANTNQADLGGRRGQGLSSIEGKGSLNELLTMDGLPNIEIYDEGYLDDSGNFQLLLPNNTVAVIGKRLNNAEIGNMLLTRNPSSNNAGSSQPYLYVWDSSVYDQKPPRRIQVHAGWAGGPGIYYPGSIVLMTV